MSCPPPSLPNSPNTRDHSFFLGPWGQALFAPSNHVKCLDPGRSLFHSSKAFSASFTVSKTPRRYLLPKESIASDL